MRTQRKCQLCILALTQTTTLRCHGICCTTHVCRGATRSLDNDSTEKSICRFRETPPYITCHCCFSNLDSEHSYLVLNHPHNFFTHFVRNNFVENSVVFSISLWPFRTLLESLRTPLRQDEEIESSTRRDKIFHHFADETVSWDKLRVRTCLRCGGAMITWICTGYCSPLSCTSTSLDTSRREIKTKQSAEKDVECHASRIIRSLRRMRTPLDCRFVCKFSGTC